MIVELTNEENENIVLDIVFSKTAIDGRRKVNGKELIDTYCQVSRVTQINPTELQPLTTTAAFQNPLDEYNKIVGKKVSLAKAIADIGFLKPIPQCEGIHLKRRSMRQHIWNVFHQTFGRWN